ncbi:MAG: glutamate-cysteine ligase family protein, partial [Microbacterium sp.]
MSAHARCTCQNVLVKQEFAESPRSSVGLEWEIMLADPDTGDLVGRAPELLAALEDESEPERHTVTGELLTNTIEVTSGVGDDVGHAISDIAAAIAAVRATTDPAGIELLSAGSHPFAQWFDQQVTDKSRYHQLIER